MMITTAMMESLSLKDSICSSMRSLILSCVDHSVFGGNWLSTVAELIECSI